MKTRDLSQAEFMRAIEKRGIKPDFCGYYDVGGTLVYARNGGDKRRSQLAYLTARQREVAA